MLLLLLADLAHDNLKHVAQVVDTTDPLEARVRALANSQRIGILQQRAWALLFERIKTGQKVTVEALGGSMAAGTGTVCGAQCSYSVHETWSAGGRSLSC